MANADIQELTDEEQQERRDSGRKNLNLEIDVELDGKDILCYIRNLSDGGAFLKVHEDQEKDIDASSIGKPASFYLMLGEKKTRFKYQGKIVRFFKDPDGGKYLAVAFALSF